MAIFPITRRLATIGEGNNLTYNQRVVVGMTKEVLFAEYELIKQKQSKYSRAIREMIIKKVEQ